METELARNKYIAEKSSTNSQSQKCNAYLIACLNAIILTLEEK